MMTSPALVVPAGTSPAGISDHKGGCELLDSLNFLRNFPFPYVSLHPCSLVYLCLPPLMLCMSIYCYHYSGSSKVEYIIILTKPSMPTSCQLPPGGECRNHVVIKVCQLASVVVL